MNSPAVLLLLLGASASAQDVHPPIATPASTGSTPCV
jgi:hypothetical protein